MKKVSKRLIVCFLVVAMLCLTLVGCTAPVTSGQTEEPEGEAASESNDTTSSDDAAESVVAEGVFADNGGEDEVYYMNVFVTGAMFWKSCFDGFEAAAKQLGVKAVYGGTTEYDAAKQTTSFEQMLALNPAGMYTHPISEDNLTDSINKAAEMGIPVATMYVDAPDSKRIGFWGTDTTLEGQYAADLIAEAIGGSGEIAIIERPQENVALRIVAFKAHLASEYPDIEIVASVFADADAIKANTLTIQMFQANPNIVGIVPFSAEEARGVIAARQEMGNDFEIVTYESEPTIIQAIRDGEVYASVGHDAYSNGYWAMIALYIAKHKLNDPPTGWENFAPYSPTPIFNILDNLIITQENAKYIDVPDWN